MYLMCPGACVCLCSCARSDYVLLEYAYAFMLHRKCREAGCDADSTFPAILPIFVGPSRSMSNDHEAWFSEFFRHRPAGVRGFPRDVRVDAVEAERTLSRAPHAARRSSESSQGTVEQEHGNAATEERCQGAAGSGASAEPGSSGSGEGVPHEGASESGAVVAGRANNGEAISVYEIIEEQLFTFHGAVLNGPRTQSLDIAVRDIFDAARMRRLQWAALGGALGEAVVAAQLCGGEGDEGHGATMVPAYANAPAHARM
jgi:hypothetical protein